MAFTPRTSNSGMSSSSSVYNNSYYVGINGHYNNHNVNTYQCTYYAIGRSGEIAGEPVTSYSGHPSSPTHPIWARLGFGDAKNWYRDTYWSKTTSIYGAQLGDIVVFNDENGYFGAGGHVAIVEAISGNTLYLSENRRCYGGVFWWTVNINNLSAMDFIGFIHNPYIDSPTPTTHTVTLNVSPTGSGYTTGQGTYNHGETATLSAFANEGYRFVRWSDGYQYTPRYWTITENLTLTAYFELIPQARGVPLFNYDGTDISIR